MSASLSSSQPNRAFALVAAAGTVAIALLAVPQASYIDDTVAFLDGARRAATGAWLGRDFSSPIGPGAFVPTALFLRLGFSPGWALSLDAAFWFALIAGLAWCQTARWSDKTARWFFALGLGLVAGTPYRIGEIEWTHTTWALRYNAVGIALAALGVLEMSSPAGAPRRTHWLIGAYAALLFWLKITNVLCLGPLALGLFVVARGERVRAFVTAIASGLLVTGAIFLVAHFSPLGYYRDCAGMVATSGTNESVKLLTLMRSDFPVLIVAAVIAALCCWRFADFRTEGRRAVIDLVLCSALVMSVHIFASTKPVLLLPALLAVSAYQARGLARPQSGGLIVGFMALAVAPMVAVWLYCGAWSLRYARSPEPRLLGLPAVKPPDIANSADLSAYEVIDTKLPHDNYAIMSAYQDAVALARANFKPDATVIVADFTNPVIAAGLGRGMTGDWIAWHWKRTVGPRQQPWLQNAVTTADWVFTWRKPPALAREKNALVLETVRNSHTIAAESPYWTLWHRTGNSSPTR